jgi:hypothetical protein
LVPSDRVIAPRSLATAEPPAVTVPVAGTGGHAPEHAPEHWDASPVSFTHRYTTCPDPSVRNVVPDAVAVVISVPAEAADALPVADAPAADDAPVPGELLPPVLLLPLAHAVTISAVATAPITAAPNLSPGDTSVAAARSPEPIRVILLPGRDITFLAVITMLMFSSSSPHRSQQADHVITARMARRIGWISALPE